MTRRDMIYETAHINPNLAFRFWLLNQGMSDLGMISVVQDLAVKDGNDDNVLCAECFDYDGRLMPYIRLFETSVNCPARGLDYSNVKT